MSYKLIGNIGELDAVLIVYLAENIRDAAQNANLWLTYWRRANPSIIKGELLHINGALSNRLSLTCTHGHSMRIVIESYALCNESNP
jgi:hypothetical protein